MPVLVVTASTPIVVTDGARRFPAAPGDRINAPTAANQALIDSGQLTPEPPSPAAKTSKTKETN